MKATPSPLAKTHQTRHLRKFPSVAQAGSWSRTALGSSTESPTAHGCALLHQVFEEQVDRVPEAVALRIGTATTTYSALERQANRLARHLLTQGVGRGSRVGMLLPCSVEAYATLLAILKAGAACVPLDAQGPADRIDYILENSNADTLVTTAALAERHTKFSRAVIHVDTERRLIEAECHARPHRPTVGVRPRDLCYIFYTSSSPGPLHGVMLEHRSVCHLTEVQGRIFNVRPEDRVYQGAALGMDVSLMEVWLAFQAGATLVTAVQEMAHARLDLAQFMIQAGVTVLSGIPAWLERLTQDISTVRLLISLGEVFPEKLLRRWARPGRRLVNIYGPTEATLMATYADLQPGKPATLGRAVPGYRVHVVDDSLRPVPPGVVGEICIGGIGIARGYVGLTALTEKRFVADPFARPGEAGSRMYRTGHPGRLDEEGNIKFHGRSDAQSNRRRIHENPRYARDSKLEAPKHATIKTLAAALDAAAPRTPSSDVNVRPARRWEKGLEESGHPHFRTGILQAAGLYVDAGFKALLQATQDAARWFRALGAKMGRSTVINAESLSAGTEGTGTPATCRNRVADEPYPGDRPRRKGAARVLAIRDCGVSTLQR